MTTRIRYRVLAACLTAKTAASGLASHQRGAYMIITLYQGSFMPSDAPEEQIQRYLDRGYIIAEEWGE